MKRGAATPGLPSWWAAVALAVGAMVGPAAAQQVSESPSPAARCLTVVPDAPDRPEYPYEQLQRGIRGSVKALLTFRAPDRPPKVTVQEQTDPSFVEAVRQHARDLRVPCLQPGEGPVRLEREYVFQPDERKVQWFSARDVDASLNAELMACARHVSGEERPNYPMRAERLGLQGRVLALLRFDAPDQPPIVKVHSSRTARPLAQHVEWWVRGLRLPCHGGQPVSSVITFTFILEGSGGYGFKDVPFRTLLARTMGIERQRLAFDTGTMKCPFEVAFSYRQPHLPNQVGEIGAPDPARRPLLEWMETINLDLEREQLDSVYGDTTNITVPCIRIDLKPKE